jgi:hypothetical protein
MVFRTDDEIAGEEEMDDEEATLADDLLDEVGVDEEEVPEDIEGFGLITEEAVAEEEEETEEEKTEDGVPLEEDAEDVDFDTFDDVDEL